MFASDNIANRTTGQETARQPLAAVGAVPLGSHAFRAQWPIFALPQQTANEAKPGDAQGNTHSTPGSRLRRFLSPQRVRVGLPNPLERKGPRSGPLTGLPHDIVSDPSGSGAGIQGVRQDGVGPHEMGDVYEGEDFLPDRVPLHGEAGDHVSPDIVDHVQSVHSEEHYALRSVRASFPGIRVSPIPEARSVVITAQGVPTELILPGRTVMFRVTWSGMYAGEDLIVSFIGSSGGSTIAIAANGSPGTLDGLVLNPDPSSYFYAKGKLALSCMVPQGSLQFVDPTLVNVQCYLNN